LGSLLIPNKAFVAGTVVDPTKLEANAAYLEAVYTQTGAIFIEDDNFLPKSLKTANIADGAGTHDKLGLKIITPPKIYPAVVTTAKLVNAAITDAKIDWLNLKSNRPVRLDVGDGIKRPQIIGRGLQNVTISQGMIGEVFLVGELAWANFMDVNPGFTDPGFTDLTSLKIMTTFHSANYTFHVGEIFTIMPYSITATGITFCYNRYDPYEYPLPHLPAFSGTIYFTVMGY
jgi:hypothetical protein